MTRWAQYTDLVDLKEPAGHWVIASNHVAHKAYAGGVHWEVHVVHHSLIGFALVRVIPGVHDVPHVGHDVTAQDAPASQRRGAICGAHQESADIDKVWHVDLDPSAIEPAKACDVCGSS